MINKSAMNTDTKSFIKQDDLNIQYEHQNRELRNVVEDEARGSRTNTVHQHVNPYSRQRAQTANPRIEYGFNSRPPLPSRVVRLASTQHFYESTEHEEDKEVRPTITHKMKQSKHLPHWFWVIVTMVLGIRNRGRWVSWIMYGVTVFSAFVFTGFGVVFVVFDISSKNTKTTAHIGFISLVIGFSWLCLGIYSYRLAARLFGDEDFANSVRRHSRTFFKISSAVLLIIAGILFQGLNLYSAYVTYTGSHCEVIGLPDVVCHGMYVSRAIFSALATVWNLMVGCMLLSVCRTHTIGIRRFVRDLNQDGKKYEDYWKLKLQNSREGEYNKDTCSILNNRDWFVLQDHDLNNDNITEGCQVEEQGVGTNRNSGDIEKPITASPLSPRSQLEQPSGDQCRQTRQGREGEQPDEDDDDVILLRSSDDEEQIHSPASRSIRRDIVSQSSVVSTGTTTDLDDPPIMSDDEILLYCWKISSRMRFTSRCLQRWLASWLTFVVVWCGDYVIYWLSHSPSILEIMAFVAPMVLLLILCSAYAEANGEGQSMIRNICPTKERYGLLHFLFQQPLQMQVFNLSITYNAMLTVILAFSVAFASRLILDEVTKS